MKCSSAVHEGYTRYAAEILLPLLSDLNGELAGLKTLSLHQNDSEYVHQSRVATRRIRAALPFFAPCFDPKLSKRWKQAMRNITKSLGQARDLDVQIDFLTQFIEEHTGHDVLFPLFSDDSVPPVLEEAHERSTDFISEISSSADLYQISKPQVPFSKQLPDTIHEWLLEKKRIPQESDLKDDASDSCLKTLALLKQQKKYNRPGLECILLRLKQHRTAIQPNVISSVDTFEKSQTLGELRKFLLFHLTKYQHVHYPDSMYASAATSISYLVQDLCWYSPYIPDERKKSMHHEMRIAAKHLRYTLEICNKMYDDKLTPYIKKIKTLQTLLGDLHDCDVWIEVIPHFLEKEKELALAYFGNDTFLSVICPGALFLLENREEERIRIHEKCVSLWNELIQDCVFDTLLKNLDNYNEIESDKEGKKNREHQRQPATSFEFETTFEKVTQEHDSNSSAHDRVIALIGDVHANLPALRVVLADAKQRGATIILNAGDMVGYGPYPDEVIQMLRSNDVISITGNFDKNLLAECWTSEQEQPNVSAGDPDGDLEENLIRQLKREVSKWTSDYISPDSRKYLASLPEKRCLSLYDRRLLLAHGSPNSITEYITAKTPKTRLMEIANSANADIIVSGHAHMPFVGKIDQVLFINTGSVGRPEDGDPRACYALLSESSGTGLVVKHIRVAYDINETADKMQQYGFPELYIRAIREGRAPDLLPDEKSKSV